KKIRYLWLLAASYFFYGCWNATYALLMLASTAITYASGLAIDAFRRKSRPGLAKGAVALSFISNLGILAYFKYGNFFLDSLRSLGIGGDMRVLQVLLPVGISFYTFQALSYTMDIYRDRLPVEKNPLRYALFVSFFPQLVAGPIERSENLLTQLQQPPDFDAQRARQGLLLIGWGLLLKIVLADTLAQVVTPVYDNPAGYSGLQILLATFAFAFQIYGDFAGYSYIAIGSAALFNIRLMENFKSPYLAVSVRDFWRRWHISLTSWFKDYVYFPLGGSRKGVARKYINTMIIFLVSGLWHGANWTFVVWGGINGALMILGEMTQSLRTRAYKRIGINAESAGFVWARRIFTFLLISFTWIFFRAQTIGEAFDMLGRVFTDLRLYTLFTPGIFDLITGTQTTVMLLAVIALLMANDARRERGHQLGDALLGESVWVRWPVYIALIMVLLVFGVYGSSMAQTQFIYFQF
ncbi:MAG: MBOAT family protein, partial [Oscillospiraceae bacterium]|nr:MBOAT family protein [Oscillospiraceae bacterium]